MSAGGPTPLPAGDRRPLLPAMRSRPLLLFLLVGLLGMAAALLLDRTAYTYLYDPGVYDHDWGRMLRTMGFLPFWLLGAVALWLHDRAPGQATTGDLREPGNTVPGARRPFRRALLLALAPTLSGIAGELLKLLIRRERPWAAAGAYVFRPFSDRPFYGGGLAMPSSHSVVAFGAAFALARLFPRTAPVWYLLAAGCALTRVAARAHFLSDVTLGALLAFAVVSALWRWRALLLMLAPTVSGIVGALLQLIIRRERPWAAGGAYVFRPFSDRPLYGGGLAMPSSHAVVAFGAAFALARIFPRTAVVWYLLAVGCALTRVAARAHFLSDVTLAALVAWAVVAWLWRRWGPGHPARPGRAVRPAPVSPG